MGVEARSAQPFDSLSVENVAGREKVRGPVHLKPAEHPMQRLTRLSSQISRRKPS